MGISPAMPSPLVLLANDDGYTSPGIRAMRAALVDAGAEVVLMAPEVEQSASSHALSLHRPMRLREVEAGVFALDGTPADCVYVALHAGTRVLPRRPDLVVSGINRGMNLGQDVFYSGTIAAAREGALRGIPALATSAHLSLSLPPVADLSARVAFELLAEARRKAPKSPRGPLVSLNVPESWSGELRATRLGARASTTRSSTSATARAGRAGDAGPGCGGALDAGAVASSGAADAGAAAGGSGA